MGKKRKSQSNSQHAQKPFAELVSEAVRNQALPALEQSLNKLRYEQINAMKAIYTRVVAIEKVLMEKCGIKEEDLVEKFAQVEDESQGLEQVDEVKKGDFVRLEVATKAKDQKEFQGSSRLVVQAVSEEGTTLGKELEPELLGMKRGEEKEVEFGEDKKMVAKLVINRVSRPKEVKKEA